MEGIVTQLYYPSSLLKYQFCICSAGCPLHGIGGNAWSVCS